MFADAFTSALVPMAPFMAEATFAIPVLATWLARRAARSLSSRALRVLQLGLAGAVAGAVAARPHDLLLTCIAGGVAIVVTQPPRRHKRKKRR